MEADTNFEGLVFAAMGIGGGMYRSAHEWVLLSCLTRCSCFTHRAYFAKSLNVKDEGCVELLAELGSHIAVWNEDVYSQIYS